MKRVKSPKNEIIIFQRIIMSSTWRLCKQKLYNPKLNLDNDSFGGRYLPRVDYHSTTLVISM